MAVNEVSGAVVDSSMKVHSALGPGLLESAYEACLIRELRKRGFHVDCQVAIPLLYDGETLDVGYRADLVVEKCVLVELKSIETVLPIHKAQLLSYLRLSGKEVGLLINFNVEHLKDGIKRVINSRPKFSAASASSCVVNSFHSLQTRDQLLRQAFF